jgi:hypothetical protein
VQGVECGVKGAQGSGNRFQGSGIRVWAVGFRGFRVQGSGFRVQRVHGLRSMEERTNPEHLHLDVALSNPPP